MYKIEDGMLFPSSVPSKEFVLPQASKDIIEIVGQRIVAIERKLQYFIEELASLLYPVGGSSR